jgi:hypothetical protein
MKCILHIGTEKTATTTLQDWLYDNQAELSKVGIYLSDNLNKTNNRLVPAYFQGHLDDWAKRNGISSEVEKTQYFEGFIERLKIEIQTAKKTHNYFVITSEHLHSRVRKKDEIEQLYIFLSSMFDEVEVVCYFRDQFDVAVSLYSTALRKNRTASVESYVETVSSDNYYYNYLKIADNWAGVFGKTNCNFRIYDRSKFIGNDIRLDFLSVIDGGVDAAKLNMDRVVSNESLSLLQGAAFRAINRNIPYWRNDKLGMNKDNSHAKRMASNAKSLKLGKITSTKSELIRKDFSETNALFFEKYFTAIDKFPITQVESNDFLTYDEASSAVEDALELGLKIDADITYSLTNEQINSLKDIALRIFDHKSSSVEDALALMKIALSYRPHGPLIKNKVEQWSALLESAENERMVRLPTEASQKHP